MTATTTKPRNRGKKAYDGPTPEEKLCADLVALLERGTTPWRREWQAEQGRHRNLITGAEYRGGNPILLELGGMLRGHTLPLWLGGAQAKAEGWFPRKGCTAARILRPQLNKREEEATNPDTGAAETVLKTWTSYKVVPVFNAADLVGATEEHAATLAERIAAAIGQAEHKEPAARLEAAEAALEAWEVPADFGAAIPCYSPTADRIRIPSAEAFASREAFAATWAHEAIHSTGHASRLNRVLTGRMGGNASAQRTYAREELIAELGAVLLCQRLEIGSQFENHAAYLAAWIEILQEGPRTLFQVLSQARQAADLIAPEAPAADAGEA
jgi:antirestriction protein ArdC